MSVRVPLSQEWSCEALTVNTMMLSSWLHKLVCMNLNVLSIITPEDKQTFSLSVIENDVFKTLWTVKPTGFHWVRGKKYSLRRWWKQWDNWGSKQENVGSIPQACLDEETSARSWSNSGRHRPILQTAPLINCIEVCLDCKVKVCLWFHVVFWISPQSTC